MGKFNEIQEETKQSFGRNSFTTRIANDAVEFDSAADQFKFLDPIDAPAITINGEPVAPGEQTQADWKQSDSSKVDYIKNKPVDNKGNYNLGGTNNNFGANSSSNVAIGTPSAPEVANTTNGTNSLVVGMKNTTGAESGGVVVVGYNNTANGVREIVAGENNTVSGISNAAIATNSANVSGQYSAIIGASNCTVTGSNSVIIGGNNRTLGTDNTVLVGGNFQKFGFEILKSQLGNTPRRYEVCELGADATERYNWDIYVGFSYFTKCVIKLMYQIEPSSGSTISATVNNSQGLSVSLTADGQWHEALIENPYPMGGAYLKLEDQISGDKISYIAQTYVE